MLDSLTTFKQMKLFQKLLCSVISHVMIFAYPKKLNMTTKLKNTVAKTLL